MFDVFRPDHRFDWIGAGPYGTRQDRVAFWLAFVLAFAIGISLACIV